MGKEPKRPNQAALVGKARVERAIVADRIARARALDATIDPTGEHHEAIARLAQICGRDVGDLLDEWSERAAAREYGSEKRDRAESERMAVVDLTAAYAPLKGLS